MDIRSKLQKEYEERTSLEECIDPFDCECEAHVRAQKRILKERLGDI